MFSLLHHEKMARIQPRIAGIAPGPLGIHSVDASFFDSSRRRRQTIHSCRPYLMAKVGLPASRDSAECLEPLPGSATRFPDTSRYRVPGGRPGGVHADPSSRAAPPAPPA